MVVSGGVSVWVDGGGVYLHVTSMADSTAGVTTEGIEPRIAGNRSRGLVSALPTSRARVQSDAMVVKCGVSVWVEKGGATYM